MKKKLFYFFIILLATIFIKGVKITAKEYCYIYTDNNLTDTIELPFYYYNLTRTITYPNASLPIINYNKKTTLIDSQTKCNQIEEKIAYNYNALSSANTIYYSNDNLSLSNEALFNKSKFTVDGSKIKGLSTQIDEEPPIITGYEKQYTTNIDYPLTLEFLLKTFSAYDNFDGNISSNIKIEYEEYTQNISKIGTYPVIISIEDLSSNKTSLTFYIQIVDTTPPTIIGKDNYTTALSSPITVEEIKNNLTASDNTNDDLSSQIFSCQDNYSSNIEKPGTYSIYFCVYDKSENLSPPIKITVDLKDNIPPVIEGLNTYTSYMSSPISTKEITYSLAAADNGNDVSTSIFISQDNYSSSLNIPGEKNIYFQAMDEYNNISLPFKVTINLIDNIKPQIFGLNNFKSYSSSPLTITHLKQQLSIIDNVDGNISSSLSILDDSYSLNINNTGTYYITFQATDSSFNKSEEFKITIENIDDVPPYFQGPNNLTYKIDKKDDIQIILSKYVAIDNIDGSLTFEVLDDTYSSSIQTGTFYITLKAIDSSNNTSIPFIVTIDVVEELLTINEISLFLQTSSLTPISLINKLINIPKSYTILEDTYTPNYANEGTYQIKYKVNDDSIIIANITTFNSNITLTQKEQKKETFFSKIKHFFINLFDSIKNFFQSLFIKQLINNRNHITFSSKTNTSFF